MNSFTSKNSPKMLKKYMPLLITAALLIAITAWSVFLLTLPSFYKWMDVSGFHNLGTAIGGLTAPAVGLLGSILLYRTLMSQIYKNESDLILMLFDRFDHEFGTLYSAHTTTKRNSSGESSTNHDYQGQRAFDDFCGSIGRHTTYPENETFKYRIEAGHVMLLIHSLVDLNEHITNANFSVTLKLKFTRRLIRVYKYRMSLQLGLLCSHFERCPTTHDEFTSQIQDFQSRWKTLSL